MSRPVSVEYIIALIKNGNSNSHVFKVDNFSLLKKYQLEEIESSIITIGCNKWKLILYPHGNEKDNGKDHVSLYLEIQDYDNLPSDWVVRIEFDLFVLNQFQPFWKNQRGSVFFNQSNTKRGFAKLISLSELRDSRKGFLVDDCAMFGIKAYGVQGSMDGTAESFSLIEKPLNSRVTWKMAKFSAFDRYAKYQSHEFVVGNRKWKIEVHPRGFDDGKGNSLSVYLKGDAFTANDVPKAKTYARYKLRVLDQNHGKHVENICQYWFPVDPTGFGLVKFMPLQTLRDPSKGYLVKDTVYVGVDFEVVSESKYC